MRLKVYLALIVFLFIPCFIFAADETLTITTYYPSPYGSYNEFKVASNTWLAYSSGSVGIGTTGPGDKLDVQGGSPADLGPGRISITGTADYTAGLNFHTASSTRRGFVGWRGFSSTAPFNAYGMYLINYDNSNLILGTNSLERVRIDTNGNVGIGTTSPDNLLTLYKPTDSTNARDFLYFRNGTYSTFNMGFKGYDFYMNGVANTDGGLVYNVATNNVGIGTTSPGAKLEVAGEIRSNGASANSSGVRIQTASATVGIVGASGWIKGTSATDLGIFAETGKAITFMSGGSATDRMTIDSTGNVMVATTSALGGKLDVLGAIYTKQTASWSDGGVRIISNWAGTNNYRHMYINSAGGQMRFYNGLNEPYIDDSGIWHDASDISLKKNIVDIKYSLNDLMKLKPRSYQMKAGNLAQIGFVAQEVEKVIPEVVSGENGKKGLSYGQLVALAVKGIQEQQKEIEALKSEIQKLKAKL